MSPSSPPPLDFRILILANHLLNYILCGSFSSISSLFSSFYSFSPCPRCTLCLFLLPAGFSSRLFVSSTLRPLRVFPPRPLRLPVADQRPLRLFRGRSRILKRRSHRIITHARFEPPSASSWYSCDPIQRPFSSSSSSASSTPSLSRFFLFFLFAAYVSSRYRGFYTELPAPSLFFFFSLSLLIFYIFPRCALLHVSANCVCR